MGVTTTKSWVFTCDAPNHREWVGIAEGDVSLWTGERIFNLGAATLEMRRSGWQVGKFVLCPTHAKAS